MATKRTTKRYEESFKQAALARIDKGEAVLAVAKDLKVHESILYGWKARRQQMAEQGGKPNAAANLKDAIILLQKAKDSMTRDLKSGKIKHFSRSQLLTLMALDALTGGAL